MLLKILVISVRCIWLVVWNFIAAIYMGLIVYTAHKEFDGSVVKIHIH